MTTITTIIYCLLAGLFTLDTISMHKLTHQSVIVKPVTAEPVAGTRAPAAQITNDTTQKQDSLFEMVTHLTDIQRIIIAYAYENSWNLHTTLNFNNIHATALCYLPAHKNRLAAGLSNGVLQTYDLDELTCIASTHLNQLSHAAQINGIAPLSVALIATASEDGQIKFWNSANEQLICERTQAGNKLPINALIGNPGKKQLLVTDASGIMRFNYDSATLAAPHRIMHDTASAICVSPDGNYCVSGARDSSVRIWDIQSGQLVSVMPKTDDEGGIASLTWLPDGKTIISAHECGKVKVTDVSLRTHPKCIHYLDQEDYLMHTAQIHAPKTDQLAVGNLDNSIKVWNLKTGKLDQTLEMHTNKINALALSPDGVYLASSSDDGIIHVWENLGLQLLACLQDLGKTPKQI